MKTILVATDLSERSDLAVERALQIAAQHGAKCHVVSVVDDALPVSVSDGLVASIGEQINTMLNGLKSRVEPEVTVLRGEVVEMLTRSAIMHEADLLVLGLHRPRFFLDGFRETTMERLVASSMVPVLLVREQAKEPYSSALVPVSFSPACAAAFNTVSKLAPSAEITSYHALHVPFAGLTGGRDDTDMALAVKQDAEIQRKRWKETQSLPQDMAETEIVIGSVRLVLEEKLAKQKPDLLAIGTHTRTGLTLRPLGGFAAEMVRQPPVDLLITPTARK